MTRRQFLKLTVGLAGAYVAGRATYCAAWEKYDLRLTQWAVPLPRLPADLHGLRLAHFSDLHVHPNLPPEYVDSVLRVIAGLGADLVVFTGDLLSAKATFLHPHRAAFAAVQAARGKYAVLGNHDYYFRRTEPVLDFLRETGWQVLRNENLLLPGTAGRVSLIGLDDPVTGRDDFSQALRDLPAETVRVMLAHTPDIIEAAAGNEVDLVLAGHTHGGQVVLPFLGPPAVPSEYGAKYAWGLFNCRGARLVVTRGVGTVLPNVRFNCPPEVVLLTLARGDWPLSAGGPARDLRPYVRRARSLLSRLRRLRR